MKPLIAAAGALLLAGTATPAAPSVVVLGAGHARNCYLAARDERSDPSALDICNQALSLSKRHSDTVASYVNRGIVHTFRKDDTSALRDYNAAIALDPNEPEAYLNKGILMLRMPGGEGEALELANLALARNTRKPALAYFARAMANEGAGNIAAAFADYRRAAGLAPEWELPAQELRRFAVRADLGR
jgi:tetratricopeptide (TPR) repeat protein